MKTRPVMKAPTIDEYIEHATRRLSESELRDLPRVLTACRGKMRDVPVKLYPNLNGQLSLALEILHREPLAGSERISTAAWAELAIGLLYFVKGIDCIPDHLEGIGFADDACLLDRIFARNREELDQYVADS